MPTNIDNYARVYFDEMATGVVDLAVDQGTTSLSTTSIIAHNRGTTQRKTALPSAWTVTTDSTSEGSRSYPDAAQQWQNVMTISGRYTGTMNYAASTEQAQGPPSHVPSTPRWVSSGSSRRSARESYLDSLDSLRRLWQGYNNPPSVESVDYGATESRVLADLALRGELVHPSPGSTNVYEQIQIHDDLLAIADMAYFRAEFGGGFDEQ